MSAINKMFVFDTLQNIKKKAKFWILKFLADDDIASLSPKVILYTEICLYKHTQNMKTKLQVFLLVAFPILLLFKYYSIS